MSAFTDSMIEDGFDDPSDYLDYLCSQSDLQEMMKEDHGRWEDFYSLPRFIRIIEEPACPNCGNDLDIVLDGYVRCFGFPACRFEKEIAYAEEYLSREQSFKTRQKNWEQLKKEIELIHECPICKNKLKKNEHGNFIYIKCFGFPVCNYTKKVGPILPKNIFNRKKE